MIASLRLKFPPLRSGSMRNEWSPLGWRRDEAALGSNGK